MDNFAAPRWLEDRIVHCVEATDKAVERMPELCGLNPGLTELSDVALQLPILRNILENTKVLAKENRMDLFNRMRAANSLQRCRNGLEDLTQSLNDLPLSDENTASDGAYRTYIMNLRHIYFRLCSETHYLSQLQSKGAVGQTHSTVTPSSHHEPDESCSPPQSTGSKLRSGERTNPEIPEPTPLFAAAKCGQDSIVQFLLEEGADVNDGGYHHPESAWSPLCTAAKYGHESTVKLLLDYGANVEAADQAGWTAIGAASKAAHVGIVHLLLRRGANPSFNSKSNWTALHTASKYGRTEVVRVLLEGGADAGAKDDRGRTPMLIAINEGHEAIVRLLKAYEHPQPPPSYETSVLSPGYVLHESGPRSARS